jgi:uncharacterized membrane protein YccF (DUF307 family)
MKLARLLSTLALGALLGGILGGWIGIPFGIAAMAIARIAVTAVRRNRHPRPTPET